MIKISPGTRDPLEELNEPIAEAAQTLPEPNAAILLI